MAGPRVVNKLPQFIADRQARAARVMTQALVLGASEASVLTPIDTSTLLNSQFRKVDREGDAIVGTVGYTAAYALAVHSSEKPVVFRRATAEREFLKKGFEAAEPSIRKAFIGALKA